MQKRHKAREYAFQILYRYDVGNEEPELVIKEIVEGKKLSLEIQTFLRQLVNTALKNLKEIDLILSKTLKHWSLERLTNVDRAILRLGSTELLYFKETPPKVAIDEAIELAKKYGTENSAGFVNGVLDAVYKNYAHRRFI
jgi:N utilization substance protein B